MNFLLCHVNIENTIMNTYSFHTAIYNKIEITAKYVSEDNL